MHRAYGESDYDTREKVARSEARMTSEKVLAYPTRSREEEEASAFGLGPVSNRKLLGKTKGNIYKI